MSLDYVLEIMYSKNVNVYASKLYSICIKIHDGKLVAGDNLVNI